MKKRLSGKSALVTGGTRGIGLAIAEKLVTDGAKVLVTGTRPNHSSPEGVDYHQVDFSDMAALQAFAQKVSSLEIDILVNNAGINKIGPVTQIETADFMQIQQVNVLAPFMLCQAAIPYMKEKGMGRIINISSIWGKLSKEGRCSYSASKFALDGMTTALAAEVAQYGVLANCVAPGFVDTDLTREILGTKGMEQLAGQVPARRLGTPKEVAEFVAWLAGPENSYISGQNIAIDGGFTRV